MISNLCARILTSWIRLASPGKRHWDREKFFELDEERRSVIAEVESLQAERNAVSKQIGLLMREGKKEEAEAAKEQESS